MDYITVESNPCSSDYHRGARLALVIQDLIGGSRRGRAGRTPPLRDPIISFWHTFSPKSTRVRGPRPPTGNLGSATGPYENIRKIDLTLSSFVVLASSTSTSTVTPVSDLTLIFILKTDQQYTNSNKII